VKVPQVVPEIQQRHACFRLSVAPSKINRWGVFSLGRIPAHRKVIEYTGQRISKRAVARRPESQFHYVFTLNRYWCIDGAVGGSGAQYINHSCDPNLRTWIYKGHILYMSKRVIEPGEELTVDYNFAAHEETVFCRCGTAICRGTINVK
jgi:SET domain-containing protein